MKRIANRMMQVIDQHRTAFVGLGLTVLVLASVAAGLYSENLHQRQVIQAARVQASIVADSLSGALAFGDQATVSQITTAIRANPEIEALIRDRLLPGRKLEIRQGPYLVRRGPGSNPYAQGVHQDHGLTPDDYMESLEAFSTPEYAQSWRAHYDQPDVAGYMVLNFWRTVYMDQPLQHMPLAICHPASVAPDDLVPAALVDFAPSGKNTNQLSLRYNPEHRWHYYPDMTTGEVLVFKIFEHFKEASEAGLKTVFHTAFAHPETPADAPERQSCEHRVGVFILKD